MPGISLIEFFLRAIPEGFLFILATYAFSKTKIDKGRFLISSLLFAVISTLIRLLPIDYGIHTLIGLIFQVILAIYINRINTIRSIQASILSIVVMFICEGINVGIINLLLKKDLNAIFSNPLTKSIYGLPSLIIYICIVGIYYFKIIRKYN